MNEHTAYYLSYLFAQSSLSVAFSHNYPFFGSYGSLFAFHLDHVETFYYVAYLDIVIVFDTYTTFVSLIHLFSVVLESSEGRYMTLMDDDSVANQTDFCVSDDLSFLNISSGDDSHIRNLESLSDFNFAQNFFFVFRIQHSLHGVFHVVDYIVDNSVESDLDVFSVGKGLNGGGRSYVESDDDRTRGSCQHYVGFGHSTYARMNYLYSYVFIV